MVNHFTWNLLYYISQFNMGDRLPVKSAAVSNLVVLRRVFITPKNCYEICVVIRGIRRHCLELQ